MQIKRSIFISCQAIAVIFLLLTAAFYVTFCVFRGLIYAAKVRSQIMVTELYRKAINYDYGSQETSDLMLKVWSPTPWMVEVYSGGYNKHRDREDKIMKWCREHFGNEASPIHSKDGAWHRGGATVHGYTWFGFSTKEAMDLFVSEWGEGSEQCTR